MNITYHVSAPIWGYSGSGYEGDTHVTKVCLDIEDARKVARSWTKAWDLRKKPSLTDREKEFLREMTECASFHFCGPAVIVKQTCSTEVVE